MGAGSQLTLHLAWRVRQTESALKALSERVAALGLAVFLILLLTANLLVALGTLLILAQLALNLQMREYRQYYFGLMMAFVLVMAGATNARSGLYLVILLAYGLSACFCLADLWLDKHRPADQEAGEQPAGRPRPPARRKLGVAAGVVALALIIYLLVPRLPAANLGSWQAYAPEYQTSEQWERQADNPDSRRDRRQPVDDAGEQSDSPARNRESVEGYAYEGFNEQMNIERAGEIGNRGSNAVVARMKAPHGTYLKARTFDRFDGERWSASTRQSRKRRTERGMVELQAAGTGSNFRQVITIEQTIPAWLPAAPRPVRLWLPATVIALDAWDHPRLPGPLREGTEYTVESRLQWLGDRPLGGGEPPRAADLQLPDELDPRIPRLARQVVRGRSGTLARATALERHLRTEYDYSLESVFESQGVTPLDQFLFEEKRGHCEYFASALAVMLRTLDIPARLITGFSATQKNPLTGFYEIRALDGHAWVEAWIRDHGWVTFEPTAFYDLPQPDEQMLSAEQINDYVRQIERAERALENGAFSWSGLFAGLWQTLYVFVVTALSYLKLALITLWVPVLTLIFLTAVLYLTKSGWYPRLMTFVSHIRIRTATPASPETAVPFYLYHLQRMARHKGIPRAPHEPMADWAARMAQQFGGSDDWYPFSEAVNTIVYGTRGESTPTTAELRTRAVALSRRLRNPPKPR